MAGTRGVVIGPAGRYSFAHERSVNPNMSRTAHPFPLPPGRTAGAGLSRLYLLSLPLPV